MQLTAYIKSPGWLSSWMRTITQILETTFNRLFPFFDGSKTEEPVRYIDPFDEAIGKLNRWYYTEVKSTAYGIVDELRSRRYITEEEEDAFVWEVCDAHEFIIYTFKARCVLLASDNHDALEEIQGTTEDSTVEQRAFYAFEADVRRFMEYAYQERGVADVSA